MAEATPELITKLKPDVVFIATGGTAIIPEISGVDSEKVVTAVDVLLGNKEVKGPVIIIGGGSIGCETALHLVQKVKRVTIVEMLDDIASDMYPVNRLHLLKLLAAKNVQILTGTTVSEITEAGVIIDERGNKSTLEANTLVLAAGIKPDNTLQAALMNHAPEVYAIGDCIKPRKVIAAIREGFRAARLI